jgi:hypothetical protein
MPCCGGISVVGIDIAEVLSVTFCNNFTIIPLMSRKVTKNYKFAIV